MSPTTLPPGTPTPKASARLPERTSNRYDDLPVLVRFLIWAGAAIVALISAPLLFYFLFLFFLHLLTF